MNEGKVRETWRVRWKREELCSLASPSIDWSLTLTDLTY